MEEQGEVGGERVDEVDDAVVGGSGVRLRRG